MLHDDAFDGTQFLSLKAVIVSQTHRLKPKLGAVSVSLDMDMTWFYTVI
jgi:hypothetical protein